MSEEEIHVYYNTSNTGRSWWDDQSVVALRLIHLFSWSGLIDANMLLNDVFKVPNLQTGRMEPLISALSAEEEEMASNMMRRLNTIFSVSSVTPTNLF